VQLVFPTESVIIFPFGIFFAGWGDYSVYVSHDGTESLTPVSAANTLLYLVHSIGQPF
jgi:hypothetical protein